MKNKFLFILLILTCSIVLSLMMLMGRLEILPVLILFNPKTWNKI